MIKDKQNEPSNRMVARVRSMFFNDVKRGRPLNPDNRPTLNFYEKDIYRIVRAIYFSHLAMAETLQKYENAKNRGDIN